MKINKDNRELIIAVLIWCALFFPMYFLWYDFYNFTNCLLESTTMLISPFKITYDEYCNIEDANKLLDWR